jgi:hypothetical protein
MATDPLPIDRNTWAMSRPLADPDLAAITAALLGAAADFVVIDS